MKNKQKAIIFSVLYGVAFLAVVYIVFMFGFVGTKAGVMEAKTHMPEVPFATWKTILYIHIALGLIPLVLGPVQLGQKSRRNPKQHRALGKVYAYAIFLNVLFVPYIAMYATGGVASTIAFLILDLLWLATTVIAVYYVARKQKDLQAHRRWILRSYATTWVFVTFRAVVAIIGLFVDVNVSFPLSVYLCIALNLLLVELYIRKNSTAGASQPAHAPKAS